MLRQDQPQVALRVDRAHAVSLTCRLARTEAGTFRNEAVTGYAKPLTGFAEGKGSYLSSIPPASFVLSCPLPLFLEFDVTISIANRILLGFAVIVALMVGLGVYAINQLDDVRAERRDDRDPGPQHHAQPGTGRVTGRTRCGPPGRRSSAAFCCGPSGRASRGRGPVNTWSRQAAATETALNEATTNLNNTAPPSR